MRIWALAACGSGSWQIPEPRKAICRLEAEASPQCHDARRKSTGNRAEVRAANIVRDLIWVEVQIVEDVVGIKP
jgi:hypothetical protein